MTLPSPDQQAIGAALGYTPVTADDGCAAYPVDTALPAERIRPAADLELLGIDANGAEPGWPFVLWQGEWYPAPTMARVEAWVFDSVVETPDERDVEPDDPDSWLSILGMI
jgi:hypothetical protein